MATDYEKWQNTINASKTDTAWDGYDSDIVSIVGEFNKHLASTLGYTALDWTLIKAMVWTESGGPTNRAWTTRPMQIGNPGDPGLASLLSGKEGGELIMPPSLKQTLTAASATASPQMNIRAGVAYLLMRFATFAFKNVPDPTGKVFDVTVKPGDSLEKIAKANGSTVETLKTLNPTARVLQPKQVLKCQKASVQKYISGWTKLTTTAVAGKYNVGDPAYAQKLDYCLSIMKKTAP